MFYDVLQELVGPLRAQISTRHVILVRGDPAASLILGSTPGLVDAMYLRVDVAGVIPVMEVHDDPELVTNFGVH